MVWLMEFDYSLQPGLKRWNKRRIKTQQPLVTVVTPYYNGGRHIRQTANCVLDQTFPWFEWIIVNDGSTNREDVELLQELEKQDPRIRVLHKENGGISSARNHGIRNAATDLILPLDGDDLLEPTFIEYCWWMLQKNPEAAWAYADCAGFQGQEYLWHKPFDPMEMKRENLLTATALIRKDVLLAIGGYAEVHKHYNEDWYAWLKIISRGGYPAQSSGEPLFWYRRNDTGVLSKVQTDRDIARKNRELIESAAAEIRNPASGILYPAPLSGERIYPGMSSWENCVYEKKDRKQILFLLSAQEAANPAVPELMACLEREGFDTGIITPERNSHQWQQKYRQLTEDVFCLENFAAPGDWAEFISYYLISRRVDCVAVSGSCIVCLLPWLREHFPQTAFVQINGREDCSTAAAAEKVFSPWETAPELFAEELRQLMADSTMAAERHGMSEALQKCSPLAAEVYVLQTQLENREKIRQQQEEQKLLNKLRKTIREVGLRGLIRKILRRIFRR